jgi:hypothetical protein
VWRRFEKTDQHNRKATMPREIVFSRGIFRFCGKAPGSTIPATTINDSGYKHKRKLLQEQAFMTPTWPPRSFPDRQSLQGGHNDDKH